MEVIDASLNIQLSAVAYAGFRHGTLSVDDLNVDPRTESAHYAPAVNNTNIRSLAQVLLATLAFRALTGSDITDDGGAGPHPSVVESSGNFCTDEF